MAHGKSTVVKAISGVQVGFTYSSIIFSLHAMNPSYYLVSVYMTFFCILLCVHPATLTSDD